MEHSSLLLDEFLEANSHFSLGSQFTLRTRRWLVLAIAVDFTAPILECKKILGEFLKSYGLTWK